MRSWTVHAPIALLLALGAGAAHAQGFAAYISPPRFEVQVEAGQTLRQVVEIQHVGRVRGNYRIYTNDWVFNPDNSVSFSDALAPDSCRPWVAIERRELGIEPGARYRYRFEITPPPGTAARECRFALMVEGLETAKVAGQLNFPVGGRIGVIVYASIGSASPRLEITGTRVATVNGQPTALVDVRNSGNAHGRVEGFVNGTDADGQRLELAPANLPILPGETRSLSLAPAVGDNQVAPTIRFPLEVQGQLESGRERLPLNARFAP
jgi:P pilus assembly chaperone PapD